jgi:hypothetical protein
MKHFVYTDGTNCIVGTITGYDIKDIKVIVHDSIPMVM